ncbi:DUF6713 family protein [Salinigranum halophilum]|uniref:DUF6713 family protein n=1 Tax=Salinigranum halophilum TaxID=2565931 RepID=UPI0010A763E6|nr:DUF6713 family protein [Salinigranum halophilum]
MAALTPVLFALTVAFLAVHELDAVRNHEWRFFFSPFGVDDDTGHRVFTALHVPLFAVVFTFYSAPAFQTGLDLFAVAHGGVHLALRDHPLVEFSGWFSGLWIYGASALGGLHLLAVVVS